VVDQAAGMVEVALRQQDRDRAALQPGDHLGETLREHRRHAFERLVEQQQSGADGERAGQGRELLLAAGKEQGAPLLHLDQLGQDAVDQRQTLLGAQRLAHPHRQQDVLLDRELGHQAAVFRHVSDAERGAAVRRQRGEVVAVEHDPPRLRRQVAHHASHQRRLARAVAADQADHGAVGHREAQAAQRLHVLDAHLERFDLQHPLSPTPPSARR
jgi:hypothetical protein